MPSLRSSVLPAWLCLVLAACGAPSGHGPADGGTACSLGAIICQDNMARTCDGQGGFSQSTPCGTSMQCVSTLGCRLCAPGAGVCAADGTPARCGDDGLSTTPLPACTGSTHCSNGGCVDLCAQAAMDRSYIGCDYWPVTLLNSQLGSIPTDPSNAGSPPVGVDGFPFAVVVANPQSVTANVHITGGALGAAMDQTVAPSALQIIQLPWQQDVSQVTQAGAPYATGTSVLVRGGAYHLTSDVPITVYQFNALSYRSSVQGCGGIVDNPVCFSYTNDSSLLLPSTALTGNYVAISHATMASARDGVVFSGDLGGFVTIVGTVADTHVSIQTTGGVRPGPGVPASGPHATITETLQPGDVLQLVSASFSSVQQCNMDTTIIQGAYPCQPNPDVDLTGSLITADQPLAVYGGHDCTYQPYDRPACDHLEQQLFPNETLGVHYMVSRTEPQLPQGEPNIVRIVSNADANHVSASTSLPWPTAIVLNRGEYVEFEQDDDLSIDGTGPLSVVQYLVGENFFGATSADAVGDPSMSLEVPVEQWRNSYEFLAPDTYTVSFLNVVADHGAPIVLDGVALDGANLSHGFDVYRIDLSQRTGAHAIRSADGTKFGIKVYGFGSYTSYMYPGGLDLLQISPPG